LLFHVGGKAILSRTPLAFGLAFSFFSTGLAVKPYPAQEFKTIASVAILGKKK
jgi:hypothetical protein